MLYFSIYDFNSFTYLQPMKKVRKRLSGWIVSACVASLTACQGVGGRLVGAAYGRLSPPVEHPCDSLAAQLACGVVALPPIAFATLCT